MEKRTCKICQEKFDIQHLHQRVCDECISNKHESWSTLTPTQKLEFIHSALERSWYREIEATEMDREISISASRRLYHIKVHQRFLTHILDNKPEKLHQKYLEYSKMIAEEKWTDEEERDGTRSATKKIKADLPDNCVCCIKDREKEVKEYHHIVPHSRGGKTEKWNIVPLCRACHSAFPETEIPFSAKIELLEAEDREECYEILADFGIIEEEISDYLAK